MQRETSRKESNVLSSWLDMFDLDLTGPLGPLWPSGSRRGAAGQSKDSAVVRWPSPCRLRRWQASAPAQKMTETTSRNGTFRIRWSKSNPQKCLLMQLKKNRRGNCTGGLNGLQYGIQEVLAIRGPSKPVVNMFPCPIHRVAVLSAAKQRSLDPGLGLAGRNNIHWII